MEWISRVMGWAYWRVCYFLHYKFYIVTTLANRYVVARKFSITSTFTLYCMDVLLLFMAWIPNGYQHSWVRLGRADWRLCYFLYSLLRLGWADWRLCYFVGWWGIFVDYFYRHQFGSPRLHSYNKMPTSMMVKYVISWG